MIAVSRTTSEPVGEKAALYALFDAVCDASINYSHTTIFGTEARDALLVWAALHGKTVTSHTNEQSTAYRCDVRGVLSSVTVLVTK